MERKRAGRDAAARAYGSRVETLGNAWLAKGNLGRARSFRLVGSEKLSVALGGNWGWGGTPSWCKWNLVNKRWWV